MINFSELNVLNPKQLEKQLKVLEGRIQELQAETQQLEKMRAACLILMGNAVDFPGLPQATPETVRAAPEPRPAKPRKAPPPKEKEEDASAPDGGADLPDEIAHVLSVHPDGLSADEIFDALKDRGIVTGKNAVGRVYSTLEQHPDRFIEARDGAWKRAGEATPASERA